MQNLIGQKLEEVVNYLYNEGLEVIIKDNNFNVNGDTKLVTNIKMENKVAVVTTGNFVFDVKNKSHE